ncbi:FAD/NAD(P)-binding protein [Amycolatopsis sp. NPDC005003]
MSGARAALVGGGPRATYLLQSLVQLLDDGATSWFDEIVVFNAAGVFGAGWVHDPGLPGYAVLNRSAEGLSLGPRERTLHSWLAENGPGEPRSWALRAEHGSALDQAFRRACRELAERHGIQVRPVRALVVDIRSTRGRGPFTIVTATEPPFVAHAVVLLVGHEAGHRDLLPDTARAPYPLPDSPLPGSTVRIDGTGLTAIELALHLTEGRGGRFVPDAGERYRYRASGREPGRITMVSPSGLLPLPRPLDADRPVPDIEPVFLDPATRGPDVTVDMIRTMILSELVVVHAAALRWGDPSELPERLAEFRDLAGLTGWTKVAEAVDRLLPRELPRITEHPLFQVYVLKSGSRPPVGELLENATMTARRGIAGDALCAALEIVLRRLRPAIQLLCDRRLLSPEQDRAVRRDLFPMIGKCVNGASRESTRRVQALVADGILEVLPRRLAGPAPGHVLSGRIAGSNELAPSATLTARLIGKGQLSTGRKAGYEGVVVNDRFQVVTAEGHAVREFFALGAPLEGFKSFQFSAARPAAGHEVLDEVRLVGTTLLGLHEPRHQLVHAPAGGGTTRED